MDLNMVGWLNEASHVWSYGLAKREKKRLDVLKYKRGEEIGRKNKFYFIYTTKESLQLPKYPKGTRRKIHTSKYIV